jgi:hypothetical protein
MLMFCPATLTVGVKETDLKSIVVISKLRSGLGADRFLVQNINGTKKRQYYSR